MELMRPRLVIDNAERTKLEISRGQNSDEAAAVPVGAEVEAGVAR